jgi:YfiR/HmsC-like
MSREAFRFKSLPVAVATLGLMLLCGADGPSREYQLKAAFIFNFTQFVQWPDSAFSGSSDVFTVAIIGEDPFNGALERAVMGKAVGSRRIVFRHFDNAADLQPCQLLFVPSTKDSELTAIMNKLGNEPVLTIGESEVFLRMGGEMRFYTEENKVRFEINMEATDKSGLKISSKLLKLAKLFAK